MLLPVFPPVVFSVERTDISKDSQIIWLSGA